MTDLRELFSSPEEGFRSMWAGIRSHMHTAMVSRVTQASDGHTVQVQPNVQQAIKDETLTQTSFVDYPLVVDSPVHFVGGAKTVLTHGLAVGDDVVNIFVENAIDAWHQNGGTAMPVSDRAYSMSDAVTLPGVRSDPRRLQQVAPDAMHARSDDKTVVHETHPTNGIRAFHADPSTPAASASFDPLSMASAFYHHLVQSAQGILGQAVSSGGTHEHGVTHSGGAFMRAMNGLHQVLAQPSGALLSAFNGAHTVTANASGVQIASSAAIALQCPPGGLGLPSGGVGSSALATGAASTNVGTLSGDLSGTLPSPQVVGLGHVDAHLLPSATSDAIAASAGVPVGGLYRNTAVSSGVSLLAVRMA